MLRIFPDTVYHLNSRRQRPHYTGPMQCRDILLSLFLSVLNMFNRITCLFVSLPVAAWLSGPWGLMVAAWLSGSRGLVVAAWLSGSQRLVVCMSYPVSLTLLCPLGPVFLTTCQPPSALPWPVSTDQLFSFIIQANMVAKATGEYPLWTQR